VRVDRQAVAEQGGSTRSADSVIETHEHTGEFKGDFVTRLGKRHARA
jgi:hypothetical protein